MLDHYIYPVVLKPKHQSLGSIGGHVAAIGMCTGSLKGQALSRVVRYGGHRSTPVHYKNFIDP